ncbi:hypothetical protein DM860_003430 [Cuscuta australis]|uniref:Uncharacterized protein n=1 Tax=Cuscuta australis TaxID=267555 RepID=A0A328DKI3_9ASTE|nr:hypothetical protein DM860_003430 [Cuscuta australis]
MGLIVLPLMMNGDLSTNIEVARPCLDIYVYGVILLQFLCGQKNISSNFVVTMRGRIEDGDDVICEKLKMSGCNGQIAADMIKLALDCTQKNTIRPSALTIVKRFGAIAVHHKTAAIGRDEQVLQRMSQNVDKNVTRRHIFSIGGIGIIVLLAKLYILRKS